MNTYEKNEQYAAYGNTQSETIEGMKVGEDIDFPSFEAMDDYEDYNREEFEISPTIGRSIIMFDHYDKDLTLTFMLHASTGSGPYIYKLIYKG